MNFISIIIIITFTDHFRTKLIFNFSMTLTQVSTWFANARRRLKKENRVTWENRNNEENDIDVDDSNDGKIYKKSQTEK